MSTETHQSQFMGLARHRDNVRRTLQPLSNPQFMYGNDHAYLTFFGNMLLTVFARESAGMLINGKPIIDTLLEHGYLTAKNYHLIKRMTK